MFAYDFGNGSAANPTFTFHGRVTELAAFVLASAQEDGRTTAELSVAVG